MYYDYDFDGEKQEVIDDIDIEEDLFFTSQNLDSTQMDWKVIDKAPNK